MKIKGIYREGKRRGTPIEFSAAEKVPLAVMDAVKAAAPKGKLQWASKVKVVGQVHLTPKTRDPKKKGPIKAFAYNKYTATGSFLFKTLDLKTDKMYPAKASGFQITFEDSLDYLGQPDLTVVSFELTAV